MVLAANGARMVRTAKIGSITVAALDSGDRACQNEAKAPVFLLFKATNFLPDRFEFCVVFGM
jgi:hypothetical protein